MIFAVHIFAVRTFTAGVSVAAEVAVAALGRQCSRRTLGRRRQRLVDGGQRGLRGREEMTTGPNGASIAHTIRPRTVTRQTVAVANRVVLDTVSLAQPVGSIGIGNTASGSTASSTASSRGGRGYSHLGSLGSLAVRTTRPQFLYGTENCERLFFLKKR